MKRFSSILLWVCLAVNVPLIAQSENTLAANLAPSALLADTPGPTAASADVRYATRALALPTIGTNLFQPSSPQFGGSQLATLRPPPLLADFSPEEQVAANTPPRSFQKTIDASYWTVTAALAASSVANAEALYGCSNCAFLPASMHRRGVTYGIGVPVTVGVAYLGYYLKKNGHHWWYAPALALTAANGFLAYHWAASTN